MKKHVHCEQGLCYCNDGKGNCMDAQGLHCEKRYDTRGIYRRKEV